jgi:hypothetical protein
MYRNTTNAAIETLAATSTGGGNVPKAIFVSAKDDPQNAVKTKRVIQSPVVAALGM